MSDDVSLAVLDAVERFSRVPWNGTVGRWEVDRFLVQTALSDHPGSPAADEITVWACAKRGDQILAYVDFAADRRRRQ